MPITSNFWKNKNVFVTGATGLLGPWLIEDLLSRGANVIALARDTVPNSLFFTQNLNKKVTVVSGDLLDRDIIQRVLNEFDINTVFHLGAQAIVKTANRSPISTFRSNIEGTWNLLESCRLSPWVKKIIVASSDKAYGEHKTLPYTEEAALQAKHPYDVSKSCADLLAQSYFHTYKLPVCVTRCGNFFGGGDLHFNRIIPGTINSILQDENPLIRSNGLFVRDYIYVKDVAHAYRMLAEQMDRPEVVGQCFNFSTDQPYNVLQLVDQILELMGAKHLKPIIQNNASNEIPEQHLSSEKARRMLGWKPQYGVQDGLKETIEWYKKHSLSSSPATTKKRTSTNCTIA
ncbi:GDP-mannose 4,6-dehydratase [Candidatus Babeliales bacterium]|nr:GDP-mannose 4,6-dehydratase [Candidatus Babeliales bacterium]